MPGFPSEPLHLQHDKDYLHVLPISGHNVMAYHCIADKASLIFGCILEEDLNMGNMEYEKLQEALKIGQRRTKVFR